MIRGVSIVMRYKKKNGTRKVDTYRAYGNRLLFSFDCLYDACKSLCQAGELI